MLGEMLDEGPDKFEEELHEREDLEKERKFEIPFLPPALDE